MHQTNITTKHMERSLILGKQLRVTQNISTNILLFTSSTENVEVYIMLLGLRILNICTTMIWKPDTLSLKTNMMNDINVTTKCSKGRDTF